MGQRQANAPQMVRTRERLFSQVGLRPRYTRSARYASEIRYSRSPTGSRAFRQPSCSTNHPCQVARPELRALLPFPRLENRRTGSTGPVGSNPTPSSSPPRVRSASRIAICRQAGSSAIPWANAGQPNPVSRNFRFPTVATCECAAQAGSRHFTLQPRGRVIAGWAGSPASAASIAARNQAASCAGSSWSASGAPWYTRRWSPS
jgi:hypothetical protein